MNAPKPPPLGDPDALRVWADEVLTAGDELGEFYLLQLDEQEAVLSQGRAARMRSLQRKHLRRLLGPLYRVVTRVRFRGGRLFSAKLAENMRGLRSTWHDDRWQELVELDVGGDLGFWAQRHLWDRLDGCHDLKAVWNLRRFPDAPRPRIERLSTWGTSAEACLSTFPSLVDLELDASGAPPPAVPGRALGQLSRLVYFISPELELTWEHEHWRLEVGRARNDERERAWCDFAVSLGAEVNSTFGLEPPSWEEPHWDDLFSRCVGVLGLEEEPVF